MRPVNGATEIHLPVVTGTLVETRHVDRLEDSSHGKLRQGWQDHESFFYSIPEGM